jgi:hypothetical protein
MATPTIITREQWGAPPNTAERVAGPYTEAVIHTEAGAVLPGDWDVLTELATVLSLTVRDLVRSIDRYHRVTRGWDDGIGYSFLIERDGTIIEGRGWLRLGCHTQQGRNRTAVGICFAGHGDLQSATGAQWSSARWLIGEGIRLRHLVSNPAVNGHRKYAQKSCPGNLVYPHLDRLRGITGPQTYDPPTQEEIIMALADDTKKELGSLIESHTTKALLIVLQPLADQVRSQGKLLSKVAQEVVGATDADGDTRADRIAALVTELDEGQDRLEAAVAALAKG